MVDDFRGKALLTAFLLSPMAMPVVVFVVGLACALGSPLYHHSGGALASYDRNLTRTALGLGAQPLYAFRRVILPLVAPGVFSAAVFAFATSFDEVMVVMLIGGPEHRKLPRETFSAIRENLSPTIAAATAMTLLAVALLVCV